MRQRSDDPSDGAVMPARERLANAAYGQKIAHQVFDATDLMSLAMNQLWLTRCSFVAADLRHATLDGCHFFFCDFRGCNLRGASIRDATFAGCDLRKADLRDADLSGTRFRTVNTGTDTGRNDMTGVLLSGAVLGETSFENVIAELSDS